MPRIIITHEAGSGKQVLADIVALVNRHETPTAGDVAKAIGVSSSTLLRPTNQHFGYPVKLLARRTRFLRILAGMMMADHPPDSGAVPPGYHDVPIFCATPGSFSA